MGIIRIEKDIRQTVIVPDGAVERIVPSLSPECLPLQEARIDLAGLSDAVEGYSVDRELFGKHELLFCLAGKGSVESPDVSASVNPGELLILPGHTRYRYGCAVAPWRFIWFHVRDEGVWHFLRLSPVHVRKSHVSLELETAMLRLLAESMSQEPNWGRMTSLFAEQVVLYIEREFAISESPNERRVRQKLDTIWETVSGRLDKDWAIRELAELSAMSPSTFYRACLHHTGLTPNHVLLRLRMQRAEQLLRYSDYPLKTIAEILGYGTPFAFSTAFKRYKNVSPRAYREEAARERK